ncbi:hypothetical protein DRO60_03980 [Candidatus Bathyarchaeota archaeon]|nr:MAG: hypothetical protein DRO60_03980 [Candidatus Bathyarchaeota archaeon]
MAVKKLRVFRADASSCNGCDIEVLEALLPRFKVGEHIELVYEPEQAEALVITGGANFKTADEVRAVYEKLREPKIVICVGSCAISKGIFAEGYSMLGPADELGIPVTVWVAGCPPRPQAIAQAIAGLLGLELDTSEEYWGVPEGFRGLPELDADKCVACGACANSCPTGAMSFEDLEAEEAALRAVRVNYGLCIYCATCQEICPEEAVDLTGEYRAWFRSKEEMLKGIEVPLRRCANCGRPFATNKQVEACLNRLLERAGRVYERLLEEVKHLMSYCPECRHLVVNLRAGKALLTEADLAARA